MTTFIIELGSNTLLFFSVSLVGFCERINEVLHGDNCHTLGSSPSLSAAESAVASPYLERPAIFMMDF